MCSSTGAYWTMCNQYKIRVHIKHPVTWHNALLTVWFGTLKQLQAMVFVLLRRRLVESHSRKLNRKAPQLGGLQSDMQCVGVSPTQTTAKN